MPERSGPPRYLLPIETGQVAVVTGGTSGIGFALADALVRPGVNVMIADIRGDPIPVAVDASFGRPGPGAAEVAKRRVDALMADLV
jgi:NAD(P)-dependent dehydrogenase (short-subunit alcohol dehydrogenase family)